MRKNARILASIKTCVMKYNAISLSLTLISFCLLQSNLSYSQWYATIDVNHVKATVRSDGVLFFDGANGQFIAPHEDGQIGVSTLKTAGLWMAGKVAGTDDIRGAIQLYNEDGNNDFMTSPLEADTGEPTEAVEKVYRVTGAEIEALLADFNDNGVIDNQNLNQNIYGWPGDNSPYYYDIRNEEQPKTFFGYKNFWDRNSDGVYDPDDGDIPNVVIRGCDEEPVIADDLLYFIFNDNVEHTESGMDPIRIEVQTMVYGFNCSESPIGNTLFLRYRINNRSLVDLDSFYVGLFADFDIGNPEDDFIGSDMPQALVYGYNGDEYDAGGYADNIPAMALDFLRGPLDSSRNEVPLSHVMPVGELPLNSPEEYYNLLSGKFPDGSAPPNGSFFFNGNPNIPGDWSEVEEGNDPGERRTLSSFGPFYLQQGAVNELIVALTFYQEEGNTPLENIEAMYEQSSQVQALYDNCFDLSTVSSCTPIFSSIFERPELEGMEIFPNPATHQVNIEELQPNMERISLSTLDGKRVLEKEIEKGQSQITVELGELPNGVYILEGWEDGVKTAREKLAVLKN